MNWHTDHYLRTLERFVNARGTHITTLGAHLAAGDRESAQRVAHSLKGVAGTLGLLSIAEIATRLDACLKEEQALDLHAERIREFSAKLGAAWDGLLTALPVHRPADAPAPVDPVRLRRVLDELEQMLDQDDMTALKQFESHARLLQDALGAAYPELQRQITDFDFGPALTTLRRWRERK